MLNKSSPVSVGFGEERGAGGQGNGGPGHGVPLPPAVGDQALAAIHGVALVHAELYVHLESRQKKHINIFPLPSKSEDQETMASLLPFLLLKENRPLPHFTAKKHINPKLPLPSK